MEICGVGSTDIPRPAGLALNLCAGSLAWLRPTCRLASPVPSPMTFPVTSFDLAEQARLVASLGAAPSQVQASITALPHAAAARTLKHSWDTDREECRHRSSDRTAAPIFLGASHGKPRRALRRTFRRRRCSRFCT